MPTYDYQCRSCGTITEVIHSMLESGPSTCERCGGELRRVLYPAGIIFKGSGFYRTDSRSATATAGSDGSKADAAGPSAGAAEPAAKGDAAKAPPPSDDASSGRSAAKPPKPD